AGRDHRLTGRAHRLSLATPASAAAGVCRTTLGLAGSRVPGRVLARCAPDCGYCPVWVTVTWWVVSWSRVAPTRSPAFPGMGAVAAGRRTGAATRSARW